MLSYWYSPDIGLVGTEGGLGLRGASPEDALSSSPWSPFSLFVSLCAHYPIAVVATAQQSERAPSYACWHMGRVSAQYGKGKVLPSFANCLPSLVPVYFVTAITLGNSVPE